MTSLHPPSFMKMPSRPWESIKLELLFQSPALKIFMSSPWIMSLNSRSKVFLGHPMTHAPEVVQSELSPRANSNQSMWDSPSSTTVESSVLPHATKSESSGRSTPEFVKSSTFHLS